jgi:hypothetical protein
MANLLKLSNLEEEMLVEYIYLIQIHVDSPPGSTVLKIWPTSCVPPVMHHPLASAGQGILSSANQSLK